MLQRQIASGESAEPAGVPVMPDKQLQRPNYEKKAGRERVSDQAPGVFEMKQKHQVIR